jgi:nitrogen-specific signal transduction histidine kinase
VIDCIRDDDGKVVGFAKITHDNTERRDAQRALEEAREALFQSQKMQAVGQLTGGVAHDFNNLLTVIIGGLDTLKRCEPHEAVRRSRALNMSLHAAERAASLTSRLLAFSRRQPLQPTPTDLNILVRNMTELLHRTLGEAVELEGVLAARLWQIEVDQNQLESAILNLAVNARDAMPAGGKLTIETENTHLDESYAATDAEVLAGQYAVVAVSDTGAGMSKETLARAFEPFYTTKEVGRGTGLGLSMVYGFVKQSGGHVTIYSEPDQGTTVKLYFPRYTGAGATDAAPEALSPPASAGEVVLVVEDNDDVRAYSVMSLTELGYQVLEAGDAEAALVILSAELAHRPAVHRCGVARRQRARSGRQGGRPAARSESAVHHRLFAQRDRPPGPAGRRGAADLQALHLRSAGCPGARHARPADVSAGLIMS